MKNTTGWILMFPFMEQGPAYDNYSFANASSNVKTTNPGNVVGSETVNHPVTQLRYKFLECPSSPTAGEVSSYSGGDTSYVRTNARRTNYLFSTGYFTDSSAPHNLNTSDIRQGAFGNQAGLNMAALTDGTSNVLLFGEASPGSQARGKTSSHFGPWGLTGIHTCCHGRVHSTSTTTINFDASISTQYGINGVHNGDALKRGYAWDFSSMHPGGAQFAFADGSIHFISSTADYRNLCRLAYIHDGEPVIEQ